MRTVIPEAHCGSELEKLAFTAGYEESESGHINLLGVAKLQNKIITWIQKEKVPQEAFDLAEKCMELEALVEQQKEDLIGADFEVERLKTEITRFREDIQYWKSTAEKLTGDSDDD